MQSLKQFSSIGLLVFIAVTSLYQGSNTKTLSKKVEWMKKNLMKVNNGYLEKDEAQLVSFKCKGSILNVIYLYFKLEDIFD